MKRFFYISLFLLLSLTTWGQTIHQRQKSESVNTFFSRIKPTTGQKSMSLDKIVLTPYRNNKDTAYIVSYSEELNTFNDSTTHRYFIYLFFPTDSNKYQMIFITVINGWEGTYISPILDSIFFANTDKDSTKEIVIFYRYQLPEGTRYDTQVFDAPDKSKLENKLPELTEMRQKLFGGFEGTLNGKTTTAKFKTVNDIKKELIRLGYK